MFFWLKKPSELCQKYSWLNTGKAILDITRDANFQDAEIVRSEERRGLGPHERPSRVQEQRHFRGLGEICHRISDVIDQIYRKYCKKIN